MLHKITLLQRDIGMWDFPVPMFFYSG